MINLSYLLRKVAQNINEWGDDWKEVPSSERDILKKYINVFLNKLKDEPFPQDDKDILRKHAKSFLKFLKNIK